MTKFSLILFYFCVDRTKHSVIPSIVFIIILNSKKWSVQTARYVTMVNGSFIRTIGHISCKEVAQHYHFSSCKFLLLHTSQMPQIFLQIKFLTHIAMKLNFHCLWTMRKWEMTFVLIRDRLCHLIICLQNG